MARWVRTAIAGLLVVGGCGRSSPYSATTQESRTPFTTTTGGPPPAPTTTAGSARQSGHWQAIDAGPLATRSEPRAVWTGNEVVVVGGLLTDQYQALADGAAFDPARGSWRRIPDRPAPGRILVAVWTGEEVVTFATDGLGLETLTTGFAFNPATNRWRPVPLPPSPAVPQEAAWTGTRLLVWQPRAGSPGALYDPAMDRWEPLPRNTVPGALSAANAVWTGTELAVEGSISPDHGGPAEPRLFLFDPARATWRVSHALPAPLGMWPLLPMVWSGREVIVTGSGAAPLQFSDAPVPTTGAPTGPGAAPVTYAYDPRADRWRTIDNPDTSYAPAYFRGVVLSGGKAAVRVGSAEHPIQLLDPVSGHWSASATPPGAIPDPSDAFVAVGSSAFHWGIATDGSMVQAQSPNAAWLWSP